MSDPAQTANAVTAVQDSAQALADMVNATSGATQNADQTTNDQAQAAAANPDAPQPSSQDATSATQAVQDGDFGDRYGMDAGPTLEERVAALEKKVEAMEHAHRHGIF